MHVVNRSFKTKHDEKNNEFDIDDFPSKFSKFAGTGKRERRKVQFVYSEFGSWKLDAAGFDFHTIGSQKMVGA